MPATRPICIAIMAMGGQGGGVLADWIVALAEAQGWTAQSTSVPGVAQRTGATIYYVEIIQSLPGKTPILSLMPVPGAVDIVIAAELLEAGRAIQRGLVTPDRTTLLASAHRALAMSEKIHPGNGIADPAPILEAANIAARRFISADMQSLAEAAGSLISAALFGALAASETLPFPRPAFEATIRAAGLGVEPSLRAFALAHAAVTTPPPSAAPPPAAAARATGGTEADRAEFARALSRIASFPPDSQEMLTHGLRRLADYQDIAYAHEYLDRIDRLHAIAPALTPEAARQLAVAMAYDDVIRVADLKTRPSRAPRLRQEIAATNSDLVDTTEFFHPRLAELCATLPVRWGLRLERSRLAATLLRRLLERPRRIRSTTILGHLQLHLLASLRPRRRTLLRHARETAHIDAWLALVARHAAQNPALALELLKCRRLVKGYSDTHARGASKFDRVTAAASLLEHRPDAADWIRRLREAALADADGKMLDGALKTVATL